MPKPDWTSAALGAASGGASGALLGSSLGPYGTAAGAVGGSLLGGASGLFGGETKDQVKQAPTQTKEQQELQKLIIQGITKGTGPYAEMLKGTNMDDFKKMFPSLVGDFNEEDFDKGINQPALKNFQENILPQILNKYNAGNQAGGTGQLRAEMKGATDLQSEINRLRYQAQQQNGQNNIQGAQIFNNMQQQSNANRANLTGQALGQQQFQNMYQQGQGSTGQKLIDATLPTLAQYTLNKYLPNQQQNQIPGLNPNATQVG